MRKHTAIGLLLLAPVISHAMGDVCGLLSEHQWAELGLSDARKSNVPAVLPADKFATRNPLSGTACHVAHQEVQTTPKQGQVKSKETFDVIVFAATADAEDERRVAKAFAEDLRMMESEPPAKEHRLLPMPQGFCLGLSIEMLQTATAWCAGLRHGGVLIVTTPERYDASGAYLPMKTKALFEVVERKLAHDTPLTQVTSP